MPEIPGHNLEEGEKEYPPHYVSDLYNEGRDAEAEMFSYVWSRLTFLHSDQERALYYALRNQDPVIEKIIQDARELESFAGRRGVDAETARSQAVDMMQKTLFNDQLRSRVEEGQDVDE